MSAFSNTIIIAWTTLSLKMLFCRLGKLHIEEVEGAIGPLEGVGAVTVITVPDQVALLPPLSVAGEAAVVEVGT